MSVALVNEAFVRRYLQGRNPVGLQLKGGSDENPFDREIIGVVGDTKYEGLRESIERER